MSYAHWHVGMKVVCVDDLADDIVDGSPPLKVGRIYEVCEIECLSKGEKFDAGGYQDFLTEDVVFIATKELGRDVGYDAIAFRPVQERKTDISVFTAMLTPMKKGVDA